MLEREAVFLLCGHAAKQPSDRALVQTALDMLAERLNYPSRSSLMNYHMQTLFFDWCSNGYSLQQFLAIQVSYTKLCDVSHAAIVSAILFCQAVADLHKTCIESSSCCIIWPLARHLFASAAGCSQLLSMCRCSLRQ